jgi:hypothetical protein
LIKHEFHHFSGIQKLSLLTHLTLRGYKRNVLFLRPFYLKLLHFELENSKLLPGKLIAQVVENPTTI